MLENIVQQNIVPIIIFISSVGGLFWGFRSHERRIIKLEEDRTLLIEMKNDIKWIKQKLEDLSN